MQRFIYEKWFTISKGSIEKPFRTHFTICVTRSFVCKLILACHDDNGPLGMERTLSLLQERFFCPKMADDAHIHICICYQCTRLKHMQERSQMQPILVSYLLELVHLDFLTLGGKQMTIEVLTFWLSWIISPSMRKHMYCQKKQHQ